MQYVTRSDRCGCRSAVIRHFAVFYFEPNCQLSIKLWIGQTAATVDAAASLHDCTALPQGLLSKYFPPCELVYSRPHTHANHL